MQETENKPKTEGTENPPQKKKMPLGVWLAKIGILFFIAFLIWLFGTVLYYGFIK